jgi:protein-tyrosine phosphatase
MKVGAQMKHKICDIHSHIVPSVDDGSLSIEMSIEMLRNAYKQGVSSIVCTSHGSCDINSYIENFNKLQRQAEVENINVNLYHGCEIYCDDDIIKEIVDELNHGNLTTINGTKYVLIEFNPYETADVILKCVKGVSLAGYTPIIAHVERCYGLSMEPQYIYALKQHGCLFQINAYSIVEESNKLIKDFARKLLNENLITFIGSDAHRTTHRPYMIDSGVNYIYQHCDIEYAKDICYRNAQHILHLN